MSKMPEGWGYLEGRQEIMCSHGVGHYAPWADKSTHGCDGCCNGEEWEKAVEAAREIKND